MEFGVNIPLGGSDEALVPPQWLKGFLERAENDGFTTAWIGDHIVRPPSYDYGFAEPLSTLAFAAGHTETMKVGTGILLLPLRHPVVVAKTALNIQYLSEDRFTLGVGLGYIEGDFEAVGVPYSERGARLSESLELIRRLFHEESVTFDGEFFQVEDLALDPRPRQPPRLVLGGGGVEPDGERFVPDPVKRRLLNADGWITTSGVTPELAADDWEEMSAFARSKGQDPARKDTIAQVRLHIVPGVSSEVARRKQRAIYSQVIGDSRDIEYAERFYCMGSVSEIQDRIAKYAEAGFDEINLHPVSFDPSELDRQMRFMKEYILEAFS